MKSGGLGDGSPPVGSRGKAPVGGLGDEVPQKRPPEAEASLQINAYNFDVREKKNG